MDAGLNCVALCLELLNLRGLRRIAGRARRGSLGGRPPAFDRNVCKRRNAVERCSNRLKQWCSIATRYDKTAQSCQAAVTLASLLMRAWHSDYNS